jgi:hypothetical protein
MLGRQIAGREGISNWRRFVDLGFGGGCSDDAVIRVIADRRDHSDDRVYYLATLVYAPIVSLRFK